MKQTEIGLIPDDWEVKTLEEICIPKGIVRGPFGGALKKSVFVSKGYKVYEQRNAIYKNITDGNYYINESKYNEMIRFSVTRGDFIISCSGTIGKIFRIPNNYYKGIINQALLKLTINEDIIDPSYFCAYFDSDCYQQKIIDDTQGGAMKNLVGMEKFRKTCFPLPPLPEQQRIAKALSDVDALISTTEKLLQKKKNIKQGAIQELLTGKKRLPGFAKSNNTKMTELGEIPEDWEVKSLNRECIIKARIGWQGLKSEEYLDSGDYVLITGTDFNNGFINWKSCNYVSEWRFKQDKNIQIKQGDVLITKDGTIGKIAFLNKIPMQGTLNSGVFVVRPKNNQQINPIFLSLVFKSFWFDNFLEQITSGSTIVHLYQKDFLKFNFPLPPKEEQNSIAKILSDMDNEIDLLNTKLEKYRNLKTAMMQQLLTGKIRLK